jgi:SAM-dependent methyltransferase
MRLHEDQTHRVAQDWIGSKAYANFYYAKAEEEVWLEGFWHPKSKFRQLFDRLNTRTLVELACGHGRHTAHIFNTPELRDRIDRIYVIDINDENVQFCKDRFSNNTLVHPFINNGFDFQPLESGSVTAIFCYDAMVHFEYDSVQSYIEDAYRILTAGGLALLHHSNYDKSPGTINVSNPHGRNFMSKNLFAHIAIRAGFKICEQFIIHWDDFRNLDCISLIEKRQKSDQLGSIVSSRSRLSGRILHKLVSRKIKEYLSARA